MKQRLTRLALLGGLCMPLAGHGQMGMMGQGGMMNMSMARHHFAMMNGIDARYSSKANPIPRTSENLKDGEALFAQNCSSCHGITGVGDGAAGKSLNPRPANIARMSKMPMATDGYLFWTIAEGGTPVGSAMPPFAGSLKEEEIWKIITYLRVL